MTVIDTWHELVKTKDLKALEAILADDAVFESPVVHTPQVGKALTLMYLTGALHTLNNETFRYVGEWHGDRSAVLEFACEIDGITVNGVDLITWNEAGKITHFKVMIRPLKAINLLHRLMGERLAKA
ncbi:nuclear transport factor 2 family protein [Phenylobacterium kunshanense]|uniref:Nuclear transport factor 2 family protein n=1 Tax=Phenylobacterium kunshanense TaxID=1445034 RepID=A0A328BR74_9CAUL|nr:nuclear transport factor 2 family protein [Phenylobacterium kunshanense]RAK67568.1 nuclear transport factor 2 family protein [Phenylobacterium kunshanense]